MDFEFTNDQFFNDKVIFAMLEDAVPEEDIWEYKSIRKPKSAHPNNCFENIPEATDGKKQSKRKRNKKRTVEDKETAKDHGMSPGETDGHISVDSSQNSSCRDDSQQSQGKETTPRKHRKTPKSKQVPPKIRPVYDGFCPNCQMPFSALLGQTPRWHVFECLDSPPVSDTECPDGLLCTSTIPSHYKKYTHLLLAQSRAGSESFSSPSRESGGSFSMTKPDSSGNLEETGSVCPKQTGHFRNVSDDSLLMIQCLKTGQPPTYTNKKNPSSSDTPTAPGARQFTEFVKKDKLVGMGLPLSWEASDSQSNSQCTHLPLPEDDFSSCEISYSPLQSDEETCDMDDSQQELFFTQSSKDGSLEEDESNSAMLREVRDPCLKTPEDTHPTVTSFLTRDQPRGLPAFGSPSDSFQLVSQMERRSSQERPVYSDGCFLMFSPASARELPASNYEITGKAKPQGPGEFHSCPSNKQKEVLKEPAVYNQVSLSLFKSSMSGPLEREGGECSPSHLAQTRVGRLSRKNIGAQNSAHSPRVCRKASNNMLDGKVTTLQTERCSHIPLAKSPLKIAPSGPRCSASQTPTKAMKQMDIGVFFGLPPKKQEEKPQEESALEGMNFSIVVSPKGNRSRKRKAQKSLSDTEFNAKDLSESQLSTEPYDERSRHRRKRHKKSNSPQERARRKRSGDLISNPESGAVSLHRKGSQKSARGWLRRGNVTTSESSHAAWGSKKTCPFYKRIPGTRFTVDAFQYGEIEGCTAYFLTHFHSDHYAGLSKHFTWPIYCSEITGNLLKNKLRVQEQYIHQLPMDTECVVDGVRVVLLDANHCPGAAMILFHLPNGAVILHTGDFRADPSMERSLLAGRKVHLLYLDTTYCSPEYTFPSQQEVIQFAINTAFEAVTLNPRALVVCGTYCIGKEKVFLAIADVLSSKVGMSQEKYKTLQCLNIPEINSLITTDMCSSVVHLLPMMQITFKGLQNHLRKCGGRYDQILAFRPTGWTHSDHLTSIADVTPQTKGNISIYGIPYSEHSSYLEMKRFVQWLKPQKIIPTVNVGTLRSRNMMEKHFREWKLEAGY